MDFYGYKGDAGECNWTPYSSNAYDYDYVSSQASLTYSSYGYEEPKLVEYSPYNYVHSTTIQPVVNCSVHRFSEPKLIEYEPPSYAGDYFYSQTKYRISYSTLEFNVPEWEEYDQTPYGGGYDPVETYGKPLPPSDEICYPLSTPQPNASFPEGFSYGSISSANAETDDPSVKSQKDNGSKPADNKEQELHGDSGDKVTNGNDDGGYGDLRKPIEISRGDIDENPSYDYCNGLGNGGYGYGWNNQVPYVPSGSGLEAIDLCESIFGYWPCLDKRDQQRNCDEESKFDPWKSTADYLFGSPFAYGEQTDGSDAYNYYGNENYYPYNPNHTYQ